MKNTIYTHITLIYAIEMDQICDGLYPSAPLENNDLEQGFEKKLNDVNSFNNHINNIKEMITYFKDKHHESKKEIETL